MQSPRLWLPWELSRKNIIKKKKKLIAKKVVFNLFYIWWCLPWELSQFIVWPPSTLLQTYPLWSSFSNQGGFPRAKKISCNYKCIASSNKCLTSRNKKQLNFSLILIVTSRKALVSNVNEDVKKVCKAFSIHSQSGYFSRFWRLNPRRWSSTLKNTNEKGDWIFQSLFLQSALTEQSTEHCTRQHQTLV